MRRWLLILLAVLALAACDTVKEKAYDAPSDLLVEKVDDGRLRLTWSYDANFEEVVYQIARKDGESTWNEGHGVTTTDDREFVDEASTDGSTVYSYKVRANYTEDNTNSTFSMPIAWFGPNTKPTDLFLEQVAESTMELTWVDNCVGEEGYKVDKRVDEGSWSTSFKKLPANTTTWQDTVALGASVSYRVYAYVGASRSDYAEDNVTSSFPAPANVSAEQTSQQQIRVKWSNNSEMQDGYIVERRVGDDDFAVVATTVDTVSVDYMDIMAGTVAYRVRAFAEVEGSGTLYSAYSAIDTVQFNIVTRGSIDLPDAGADVFVDGVDCFVANEYSGLLVIDASNESAPVVDYSILLDGRAKAVKAEGNLLYATNQSGGMHIIDISTPMQPLQLGYCETIATPYDVEVDLYGAYPYAWVADGQAGVLTVALGGDNPANPRVVNRLNTFGVCYALALDDDVLYVADGGQGVKKIDISDPLAPVIEHETSISGEARGLKLVGGELYVAAGEGGLVVLDANSLNVRSTVATGGFATDVDVIGSYVLLADRDFGLVVVDMVADSGPAIAARVATNTPANAIMIQNNYAYITTDDQLLIVQFGP